MLHSRDDHRKFLLSLLYEAWNKGQRGEDLGESGSVLLQEEELLNAISYLRSHGLIKPWIDQGEVYVLTERGVIVADRADRNLHADLDSLIDPTPSVSYHNTVQGNTGPVVLQQAGHGAVQHQAYSHGLTGADLTGLLADVRAALNAPGLSPEDTAFVEQHLQLVEAHSAKSGNGASIVGGLLQAAKLTLESYAAVPAAVAASQKIAAWLGSHS